MDHLCVNYDEEEQEVALNEHQLMMATLNMQAGTQRRPHKNREQLKVMMIDKDGETRRLLAEDSSQEDQVLYPILTKYSKKAITIKVSQGGNHILMLMPDGDIILYSTIAKYFDRIKGVQKYDEASGATPPILLFNEEASVIIIKSPSDIETLWLWSRAKDQGIMVIVSQEERKPSGMIHHKLFRSNSQDRGGGSATTNKGGDIVSIEDESSKTLKGSWMKVLMRDHLLDGPSKPRLNLPSSFDVKFRTGIKQTTAQGCSEQIFLFQTKLFSKREYFGAHSPPQVREQSDEEHIVEFTSQRVRLNFADKGGTLYEASVQNSPSPKTKVSQVEYIGGGNQGKSNTIISKLDSSSQLSFTVINSPHMVYCQAFFTSFDTSLSVNIKLFDYVTPDDCPSFDNRGKTNLCIDDAAWTKNDAFIILIFNFCTFAVLPRLGNSLIAIFNPTIANISIKQVDSFHHYRCPRKFNELVLPLSLIQKNPSIKQEVLAQRKTITIHPSEEAFLISDGQSVCFSFRMEFEPELSELFGGGRGNLSFFFVRFCMSLERLVVDQDILEKIPQLLTNKLPLFEFEKNAELDEDEEDPGQVILTASQINPYEHGMRRMETNQSFNADFKLDCHEVLLNLKHLLLCLRWNKASPINYFQWLVTVINDCFFYFLKCSEPLYAYHALRVGEAYIKNVLFKTTEEELPTEQAALNKDKETAVTKSQDLKDFQSYFDIIHNMYDYRNTKESKKKTTTEKLESRFSMYDKAPARLLSGSGHWRFQFTKNYTLLVYYSLIQFRNYQAANFNILFLVFACYIIQKYLDRCLFNHLQTVMEVIFRNFEMKKKSDDYEMFLGKSGKNIIIAPHKKIKVYRDWAMKVLQIHLQHLSPLMEQDNLNNLMDTSLYIMQGNHEKADKNLSYLGVSGQLLVFHQAIAAMIRGQLTLQQFLVKLKLFIQEGEELSEDSEVIKRQYQFTIQATFFLLTEVLRSNDLDRQCKFISFLDFLSIIQKMMCRNSQDMISQASYAFNHALKPTGTLKSPSYLSEFCLADEFEQREILSILYLQLNELDKACSVLSPTNTLRSSTKASPPLHVQLMKMTLLSTIIKQSLRYIDNLSDTQLTTDMQSKEQVLKVHQKGNCVQTIRAAIGIVKDLFSSIYIFRSRSGGREANLATCDSLQAIFSLFPTNLTLIMKEELLHFCLEQLKKILVYSKLRDPLNGKKQLSGDTIIEDNYKMAISFLKLFASDPSIDLVPLLIKIFGSTKVTEVFLYYLQLAIISCIDSETNKCMIDSKTNPQHNLYFKDEEESAEKATKGTEKIDSIPALIVKSFRKFSKILLYINELIGFLQMIKDDLNPTKNDVRLYHLEAMLKLSFFDKYQYPQTLIADAISLVRQILQDISDGSDLGQSELEGESQIDSKLSQILKMFSFSSLNRLNKQSIAQLMEFARTHLKSKLPLVLNQFENIMFQTVQTPTSRESVFEILKNRFEVKVISKINNDERDEARFRAGIGAEIIAKNLKIKIVERCSQVKEIFGVKFNDSYFFDSSHFEKRAGHILGMSDSLLERYKAMKDKKEEQQKKKIRKLKIDNVMSFRQGDNQQQQEQNQAPIEVQKIGLHPQHMVLGLKTARKFGQIMESPPSEEEEKTDHGDKIKGIALGLMRNRQLGIQNTPKASDKQQVQIVSELKKLESEKAKYIQVKQFKTYGNQRSATENIQAHIISHDTVEKELPPTCSSMITITKRKNSVNRELGFEVAPKNLGSQKQKQIPQHRKGQMSMAQGHQISSQIGGGLFFNFSNLRQTSATPAGQFRKSPSKKPPTGLPKVQALKREKPNSKSEAVSVLIQILEKAFKAQKFQTWKQATRRPPFALFLVKKAALGEKYHIQDLTKILRSQPQVSLVLKETPSQPQSESVIKKHKKGTKKLTKEQKKMLIGKFKQLSEKIEMVYKEADKLNQEYLRQRQ